MYTPPPGAKIRYKTRRHWWEIVAEVSDFVFWTLIVGAVTTAAVLLLGPRWVGLALFEFYALGHIVAELIRWNWEWYVILDFEEGDPQIVKVTRKLQPWKGFPEKLIKDPLKSLAIIVDTDLFSKFAGYGRLELRSPVNLYLEGDRVPLRLVEELERKPPKVEEPAAENERALIVTRLEPWVQLGILEKDFAAMAAKRLIMDHL